MKFSFAQLVEEIDFQLRHEPDHRKLYRSGSTEANYHAARLDAIRDWLRTSEEHREPFAATIKRSKREPA